MTINQHEAQKAYNELCDNFDGENTSLSSGALSTICACVEHFAQPSGEGVVSSIVMEFGKGGLIIGTGVYDEKQAVFIRETPEPGPVGGKAPDLTEDEKRRIEPGEQVLLFPTEDQARIVADALCNAIKPSPASPSDALKNDAFAIIKNALLDYYANFKPLDPMRGMAALRHVKKVMEQLNSELRTQPASPPDAVIAGAIEALYQCLETIRTIGPNTPCTLENAVFDVWFPKWERSLQALRTLPARQDGDVTEQMIDMFDAEFKEWGKRFNKIEKKPHEVYRHEDPEIVSPKVVAAFADEDEADEYLHVERFKASIMAMYSTPAAAMGGEGGE